MHTQAHTHSCVHCILSYKLLRDNTGLTKIGSVTQHLGFCTIQKAGYRSRNYHLYQISSETMGLFREMNQAYEMTDITSPLCANFTQFL